MSDSRIVDIYQGASEKKRRLLKATSNRSYMFKLIMKK